METTESRIKSIIAESLGVELLEVEGKDAHLENDLGADSMDRIELGMIIEEEFGIEIPDAVCSGFETVGDVVRYVEGLV